MRSYKKNNFWQDSRWKMYGATGVYCICTKGLNMKEKRVESLKIWYVGSSKDIGKRLNNSKHPFGLTWRETGMFPFVRFIITDDYINLEKRLIRLLNPILNKTGKKKSPQK